MCIILLLVLLSQLPVAVAPAVTVAKQKAVGSSTDHSDVRNTDNRQRNVAVPSGGDSKPIPTTTDGDNDDDENRTPKRSGTIFQEGGRFSSYESVYESDKDQVESIQSKANEPAITATAATISITESTRKVATTISRTTPEKNKIKDEIVVNKKNPLDVIELTSKTFSSSISDGNIWLIEFYSPNCIHCIEFANPYSEIASYFHSRNYTSDMMNNESVTKKKIKRFKRDVKVAKVDGSIERSLLSRFGIYTVPQLFIIDGWTVYEYNHPHQRNKESIVQYVENKFIYHNGEHLKTTAEHAAAMTLKTIVPIRFYSSPMGPLGQLHGVTMCTFFMIEDIFIQFQTQYGIPNVLTSMIVFGSCFFSFFIMIVLFALLIPPTTSINRNHIKND